MKKILILIVAIILISCQNSYKKPFTIISKHYNPFGCNGISYVYQDSNGNKNTFCDTINYNIGDIIK